MNVCELDVDATTAFGGAEEEGTIVTAGAFCWRAATRVYDVRVSVSKSKQYCNEWAVPQDGQ